jgi:hypothetical protein
MNILTKINVIRIPHYENTERRIFLLGTFTKLPGASYGVYVSSMSFFLSQIC